MDMSYALKKRVLELCKAKEISIGELARVCEISSSGLRKILNGKSRGPKIDDDQKNVRRFGNHLRGIFLYSGIRCTRARNPVRPA